MGWRGRLEGGSGWGTHVNPWLIHVNVWQKPLQYCKVISLQLIKINGKKKQTKILPGWFLIARKLKILGGGGGGAIQNKFLILIPFLLSLKILISQGNILAADV